MIRAFAILAVFYLCTPLCMAQSQESSEPYWKGTWRGIPELLAILGTVPEGKKVIAEALASDPDFKGKISRSTSSYTESTFVRTYSLLDAKESFHLKHQVHVNEYSNLGDAVVDLAHELIHFSEKEMLDPYKPGFTLREFIKNGIEGPGGELIALERECLVAWELEKAYKKFPKHNLCAPYNKTGKFDRVKARIDYYAVGQWFEPAPEAIKRAFPEIHKGQSRFTSSYAGKPYPIALFEEFEMTKKAACENNRRKYRLIAAQSDYKGRAPAGAEFNALTKERNRLKKYETEMCLSVTK